MSSEIKCLPYILCMLVIIFFYWFFNNVIKNPDDGDIACQRTYQKQINNHKCKHIFLKALLSQYLSEKLLSISRLD